MWAAKVLRKPLFVSPERSDSNWTTGVYHHRTRAGGSCAAGCAPHAAIQVRELRCFERLSALQLIAQQRPAHRQRMSQDACWHGSTQRQAFSTDSTSMHRKVEISQACVDGIEPPLRLLQLCPQPHLAYGHDLDREGVLVVVRGVLLVVGDQLLVMAIPNGHHSGQEVNEFGGVGTLAKEEVDALKAKQAERRSAPPCWPAGWQAAPSWSTALKPNL